MNSMEGIFISDAHALFFKSVFVFSSPFLPSVVGLDSSGPSLPCSLVPSAPSTSSSLTGFSGSGSCTTPTVHLIFDCLSIRLQSCVSLNQQFCVENEMEIKRCQIFCCKFCVYVERTQRFICFCYTNIIRYFCETPEIYQQYPLLMYHCSYFHIKEEVSFLIVCNNRHKSAKMQKSKALIREWHCKN